MKIIIKEEVVYPPDRGQGGSQLFFFFRGNRIYLFILSRLRGSCTLGNRTSTSDVVLEEVIIYTELLLQMVKIKGSQMSKETPTLSSRGEERCPSDRQHGKLNAFDISKYWIVSQISL